MLYWLKIAYTIRMKLRYGILLGILLLVGVGSFFLFNKEKQPSSEKAQKPQIHLPKEVTVTLDENGFSPEKVTIKTGVAVRWKNESGEEQSVNSDEYPTNQLHKELNFGVFSNGSSVVYTFTKPGIYGYHNQLHPEQKGTIIVTK